MIPFSLLCLAEDILGKVPLIPGIRDLPGIGFLTPLEMLKTAVKSFLESGFSYIFYLPNMVENGISTFYEEALEVGLRKIGRKWSGSIENFFEH